MSGAVELLAQAEVGQDSADLIAQAELRQDTVDLLSNFRVSCPRRLGGNWQRKMWFDGTYYWRGRYDSVADELIFEYIAADNLVANGWTKNANASIDCSGFAADWIIADFTVRGAQTSIRTTIHYSDGIDTWVAESDEASLTGWAWQNTSVVFDGTAPDYYRKVNLCADRKERLWAIAVFYDQSEGKQWVKASEQISKLDITAWGPAVDISNVDNTNTILGCSTRSMGEKALKDNIMVVYKEGDALRSRYYNGTWQAIQDIDTTTLPGKGAWDFEHGEAIDVQMGHVVYVDADGSVKWRERDAGAAEVWSAAETLHDTAGHLSVGIAEHGSGWLWVVWVEEEDVLEYRLHRCLPEEWYPLLASPALQFNVNTDAIVKTSTVSQIHVPDGVPAGQAVPICWIGETAPATPCAVAWGILIEYSIGDLMGMLDIRQLTSTDLNARLEVGQDSAELLGRFEAQAKAELFGNAIIRQPGSAELLGNAVVRHVGIPVEILSNVIIRHVGTPVDLLENAIIRQPGSAELMGKVGITHSVDLSAKFELQAIQDLLGRAEVRRPGSAELLGNAVIRHMGIPVELLGNAVIKHVGTPQELQARFEVGQDSEILYGRFRLSQDYASLFTKTEIQQHSSADLLGKINITHSVELLGKGDVQQSGSAELLSKGEVGQNSAELLGRFEAQAIAELLGKAKVQHSDSTELLGNAVIRHLGAPAELLGRAEVRQPGSAELLGRKVIRHVGVPFNLLIKAVIRHTGIPRELVARCVIRNRATKDLDANVVIVHWEDLFCKSIICHTDEPLNLPAIFWARWPRRLWTSRRYVNGVIELDEKLLGDASLEYVIEGVMEDTQGYLDNAGLPYSGWIDITLVPVQILRAVTYGTVAALYARHTQTFRSQVIPSITPVTVTVIGDAEKAMNYWEGRTNEMLEFYVTSQGGDIMLTSTLDEEPIFSMEDIPEEVTEFVSWRVWLQRRNG